ncbi:MAG: isoleucine--tRNA ligase [Candidatus Dojkabacteria bacterium]|nr:MAG: isoleucine--tRNA ligase [Candidatus Dojkabacteria bacterium]
MFQKPENKPNFYEIEQKILNWWKENKILEKSIELRPEDNIKTFYDGPITANGAPHHGHMLTFAMKDIIPRYWTMKGYRVTRSLGWDCQGIPVEYEIEKKLGFKEKKDIEKFGIAKFNELCRNSVLEHKGKIIELEEKMGRLTNSEEEYATMDKDYIESIWWSLSELYKRGLLYEGFKVVPYSTRAGTTLSNAEVALGGYKPVVDPAVTVKFRLLEDSNTFVLAWTTTPWTLPTNFALAVGKDITYVKVKANNENYIVAQDLAKQVFEGIDFEVVQTFKGSDLVGKKYLPLFDYFKDKQNAFQIYEGFHVTTESGTGVVHLAPYGAEDNEIFQNVGIESIDVLDEQGDFTSDCPDLEGLFYKDANEKIIQKLTEKNLLFKKEDYEHDMPMCWRTNTPLIYKPITSWYIAMSKLRKELLDNNEKINWEPDHVKEGRFGNWLAEIKDWGISRLRYWGTPLPIWKSESGKVKIFESFSELEKLTNKKVEDPHRPFIDEFEFEFEGEVYKRIPDVLDVWYDSGAMPFARFHYPFENKNKFEQKFPADYISESVDQTRGWFYSLHAIGTALFNSNAFKNVVMSGLVLDDNGAKLSKSKGNYTAPETMLEQFGADTIRLNFFSTPIASGEDTTISAKTLKIQAQETILPLWNIYKYIVTYAEIHDWQPKEYLAYNERMVTDDDHPWDHIPFDDITNALDAWILLKLQQTIKTVNDELENYKIPKATRAIKEFVSEISKWYIRRSRDRFVNGDERALETLYYVFVETLKLLAPFTPFITEEIYQQLVVRILDTVPESIHLCNYPEADLNFINQHIAYDNEMLFVRRIVEIGHSLRTENNLKLRQPLSKIVIENKNQNIPVFSDWMKEIIMDELNVKMFEETFQLARTRKFTRKQRCNKSDSYSS